ncbi:MAG: hypothetical protein Pg6A_03560 [Termitinemataceae bacterium]|nr:MAG: hypothetical protein Pg6A_03560 [Termitinemataceae bacterium]
MIEEALTAFVDSRFATVIDSYLTANMGQDYKKFRVYIFAINDRNKELAQIISEKEARISKLEKLYEERASEIKMLSNRIEKFETAAQAAETAVKDAVLSKFNQWAANPFIPLPTTFTYLAGDFRIRTANQQIIPTPEESKWISNREGAKKYLLPNPCLFNQMTNISELYEMDQTMLKEKGKNKIKIVVACEISSSGFVEFPGKLEVLP